MSDLRRSDVWCTNCGGRFIATLDLSLNGNHEITCPLCQHVHYRVVRDGEVTEDRYRSSAGLTYFATTSTHGELHYLQSQYGQQRVEPVAGSHGLQPDMTLPPPRKPDDPR